MNLSFKEDHISQIPALQLLQKLGYTYLTPDEALVIREEKISCNTGKKQVRQLRKKRVIPKNNPYPTGTSQSKSRKTDCIANVMNCHKK